MKVAEKGAKNAVLEQLEELVPISGETRMALEKLTIKELLGLTKDIKRVTDPQ